MTRIFLVFIILPIAACHNDIYVRDGVTDGNKFHVSTQAMLDNDPIQQSWAAYSIAKSVCQLEIETENPARASSYGCELSSRIVLLDTWQEMRTENSLVNDTYLDTLATVREASYLEEYVVHYFGNKDWFVPAELEQEAFKTWRLTNLKRHKPYTRIVGSWSYSETSIDNE